MRSDCELPMPWPEFMLVRKKIGWPELVAACNAAVNLRECQGFRDGLIYARAHDLIDCFGGLS